MERFCLQGELQGEDGGDEDDRGRGGGSECRRAQLLRYFGESKVWV
jgi:hypothetical protein